VGCRWRVHIQNVLAKPLDVFGQIRTLLVNEQQAISGAGKEKRKISDHHLQTIDFL
jgi:hypothetical protein